MQPSKALLNSIRLQFQHAQSILVVSHIRPDGDAVGSLLGLGLALQAAGKDVQMVLSDGVPANFSHLEGSALVRKNPSGIFNLSVVVDCSDMPRIGHALNGYGTPVINIDHHITNLEFARFNLVVSDAVATSEILARHLTDFDLPMTQLVANALLTGIISDTIGFRTKNMNPGSMRVVAALMEAGGDLNGMYYPTLVSRTYPAALYWGAGLTKLQREYGMVWTTLSLEDRKAADYPGQDDADLINVLSAIEDAQIALIFVQQTPRRVKISWRLCGQSFVNLDVSRVALQFGGGGHKAAAGAELDGSFEEVQEKVLAATRRLLVS